MNSFSQLSICKKYLEVELGVDPLCLPLFLLIILFCISWGRGVQQGVVLIWEESGSEAVIVGGRSDPKEIQNNYPGLEGDENIQAVEIHVHTAADSPVAALEFRMTLVYQEDIDVDQGVIEGWHGIGRWGVVGGGRRWGAWVGWFLLVLPGPSWGGRDTGVPLIELKHILGFLHMGREGARHVRELGIG